MRVGSGVSGFGIDADLGAIALDAALQHEVQAQVLADLLRPYRLVLVGEGGRGVDDERFPMREASVVRLAVNPPTSTFGRVQLASAALAGDVGLLGKRDCQDRGRNPIAQAARLEE